MFSWFRKEPRPPKPATGNPGRGHKVQVGFSNVKRTWAETDDLATSLSDVLNNMGQKAVAKGDWVELEGGFALLPQVVSVEPFEDAGVKTATTIQTSHPALVPAGIFEFQYSSGTDIRDSFAKGFKNWAELDLPVFQNALRAEPEDCMVATMEPNRRIVFGPTIQMAEQPEAVPGQDDFCPCCLFSKNVAGFQDLLKDDTFYGVRLFVSRNQEGLIEADCRVNGVDRPEGAAALERYAKTWPKRGFEYRKQYVAIQARPSSS
jgi:hypothetical protein